MKRIIVPTDFSKLSEQAIAFAVRIAKDIKAEVSILHLEDMPLGDTSLHLTGEARQGGYSEDDLYNVQLFRANTNKLKVLSEKYEKKDVVVTGQQLGGGFLKGLEHFIEMHGGDLIVMGTTGEESIQELFSGNHTEQLIENLDVPVLSIQHQADDEIKDIVVGIDLQDESYTKDAFAMIKVISESLDARVHVVNIVKSEQPEALMSDLNNLAKGVGLKNYIVDVISSKNENKALMEFAEQLHAGLIVTLSEARAGLYRFIQHSFATKMTKTSAIPVLTINKRLV